MTDEDGSLFQIGDVLLGKLEVTGFLGRGGMGAVYEVRHQLTRHLRALKVLHPRLADSETAVSRFLREAGVAGTLNSPHVVETFDAGLLPNRAPYVLMEKLEGETLGQKLEGSEPLDVEAALTLITAVIDGVAAAHAAGIVHRDLKPDNLFLVREAGGSTRVKILDFGISKFSSAFDRAGDLTAENSIMGTPHYMSPEQAARAEKVDGRTDIYALGVILYEILSGTRPFDDESLSALVVKIHEGTCRPLVELAPQIDPGLAAVVAKAMHRDPNSRHQSVVELRSDLARFRSGAASRQTGSSPLRRWPRSVVASLVAIAGLIVLALGVAHVFARPEASVVRSAVPVVAERAPLPARQVTSALEEIADAPAVKEAFVRYVDGDFLGCLERLDGVARHVEDPRRALTGTLQAACRLAAGDPARASDEVDELLGRGVLAEAFASRLTPEFQELVHERRSVARRQAEDATAPTKATRESDRGSRSAVRPAASAMLELDPYGVH